MKLMVSTLHTIMATKICRLNVSVGGQNIISIDILWPLVDVDTDFAFHILLHSFTPQKKRSGDG